MIRVLKSGLMSTVQDAGRAGYQCFGVSIGGAADPFAFRVANALVGNDAKAAGLEMTFSGPRLQFDRETLVAWCGADFDATLDDQSLPKNRPVRVPAGGVLNFAGARTGTTAWLSVSGGIIVPQVLGSRSTDLTAGIGGLAGRRLAAGDVLPVGGASRWEEAMLGLLRSTAKPAPWSLPPERLGVPAEPGILRTVRGPEWDWFASEAHEQFFREAFRVNVDSNRMGVRLAGPALVQSEPREMISAAVHHGVVQVPVSGQPIVLGAGRQTIGGYPRIGAVTTIDFGLLAQLRPGDAVRFREVTIVQAHDLLRQRERGFAVATRELARRIGLHEN